ncbi:hypothetical protein NDI76_01295 [Halogeometricum sp. S1BR25-6]|uniref:Small CPxCG-related zinc finger protein n=1 Tax=Halogeometricum salsisoli TaxID=2950536 RepID=A0ABU2G9A7_9EURY|nr:hypothetical protein [Halogeometricum sp. S1BR25-6]MDS0297375.1 hypothetical protein [Halogeometricum sp. S1BR25-6]
MTEIRRCPDCGVTMESMKLQTAEGFSLHLVTNERKKGFLGGFGLREKLEPTAYVCPECGLIRSYAERDESE